MLWTRGECERSHVTLCSRFSHPSPAQDLFRVHLCTYFGTGTWSRPCKSCCKWPVGGGFRIKWPPKGPWRAVWTLIRSHWAVPDAFLKFTCLHCYSAETGPRCSSPVDSGSSDANKPGNQNHNKGGKCRSWGCLKSRRKMLDGIPVRVWCFANRCTRWCKEKRPSGGLRQQLLGRLRQRGGR